MYFLGLAIAPPPKKKEHCGRDAHIVSVVSILSVITAWPAPQRHGHAWNCQLKWKRLWEIVDNIGTPNSGILYNRMFHYKPSLLGGTPMAQETSTEVK